MSEETTINQALLEATLERFGANPMRWPDATRGALEALIDSDPAAKALVKEFAALDQVLSRAGETAGSDNTACHDELADKIMRSIATSTSPAVGGNVVAFEAQTRAAKTPHYSNRGQWPNVAAASALAASLLLGITVGATGIANTTLAPVSEVLGLGSIATETAALSDPIFDIFDANSEDDDVL